MLMANFHLGKLDQVLCGMLHDTKFWKKPLIFQLLSTEMGHKMTHIFVYSPQKFQSIVTIFGTKQ